MLYCPECGNDEFQADHSAVVRRTYRGDINGGLYVTDNRIEDIDRDVDEFTCTECEWAGTEQELSESPDPEEE